MKSKNDEILELSRDIMEDITNSRIPLDNIMLKASLLALLANRNDWVDYFSKITKTVTHNIAIVSSYKVNIEAAKDPDISIQSANPYENLGWSLLGKNNKVERSDIQKNFLSAQASISNYKTETFNFAMNIYNKWKFGELTETIFEKKRLKVDSALTKLLPDINQRMNSITNNLNSASEEDLKNIATSCRRLIMDIADSVKSIKDGEVAQDTYKARLKAYIKENVESNTKADLVVEIEKELDKRINNIVGLTQQGAHNGKVILERAEDIVLYTYLFLGEIAEIYESRMNIKIGSEEK